MARKKTKRKSRKSVRKRTSSKKRITRAKKRVPQKKKRPLQKRLVKRRVKKTVVKRTKENIIGLITHYFPRVKAAVVKLKAPLTIGDTVRIKGHTTNFTQVVNSIQIDRQPITKAKRGQEIGLLVDSRVRHKDVIYKV